MSSSLSSQSSSKGLSFCSVLACLCLSFLSICLWHFVLTPFCVCHRLLRLHCICSHCKQVCAVLLSGISSSRARPRDAANLAYSHCSQRPTHHFCHLISQPLSSPSSRTAGRCRCFR